MHFLHIPKNAGSSFKSTYPSVQHTKHYNALPSKNKINIAVLRNPYSRLKSIFAHIKDRTLEGTCNDLVDFDNLDRLAEAYYNKNDILHNKAKNLLYWDKQKFSLYKLLKGNGGCPKKHNYPCIHWAPQSLYLGNLEKIDYLIRFEYLNYDINRLFKKT